MVLCVALDNDCDNEQKTIRMLSGFTTTESGFTTTIKIFAQKFQLDGFFLWFLGLWTTHSCRETFVTNLFTEILTLALTNIEVYILYIHNDNH